MSKLPTATFRDGTTVVRRCPKCKRFVSADMLARDYTADRSSLPTVYCPTKCKDIFIAEVVSRPEGEAPPK